MELFAFAMAVIGVLVIIAAAVYAAKFTPDDKLEAEKQKLEAEKQKLEAEKQKLEAEYAEWWVKSSFNSFKVIKKYTTLLSKEDRYRQVLQQIYTGKFYDEVCNVQNYYNFDEGDFVKFVHFNSAFAYDKESAEEFDKETGNNLLERRYQIERALWSLKEEN